MKSITAIIPAKSHSRRLPNKNILKLKGKELFLYSIELAQKTSLIDEVIVSSDSDKILGIAKSKNVKILKREKSLCSPEVTNFEVLYHTFNQLKQLGNEPEIIVLIQPTTPFRYPNDLDAMLSKFKKDPFADSLITVKDSKRVKGIISNKYWIPNNKNYNNLQSSKNQLEATGHIIALRPKQTLERNSLLGESILPHNLPVSWPDIDIDTKKDWEIAESFISNHKEVLD